MNNSILFKIASVLWFIWGAVHMLAGVMTMRGPLTGDISAAVAGIADKVDPASLQMDYPVAAGAILGQHGFNLLWIGLVTLICSFYIWRGNRNAIILAAITGGLADVGYFLFMDLGGHVNFMPGTVMTIFSATAIILSFYGSFNASNKA
ncbi:MAG: hypothetical protein HRU41_07660 [Saprospiraceae bacterium]|nr:hypothetical protein [Saprospiraceae bacterium]